MIKNKRGFQLSINMIIIVVIALVFLGVVIGLIMKSGKIIEDKIPELFGPDDALWKPDANNPVYLSPPNLELDRGENKKIDLQIFNYAASNVTCSINFDLDAEEEFVEFRYSKANRPIPVGMVGGWTIGVVAPKTTPSDLYIYTVNIECEEFSKQSDILVTIN
ncbi:MAG: hypothetical protein MAG795_00965 [Candidatus Woesearchaeota archaeon]|nr:hypothetical protein [Candidatus Woesearchaeota archaeon]